MKKIFLTTVLIALSCIILMAQVPQAFKYQAVVRDNSGAIIANQDIQIKISILLGSSTGTPVYVENHQVTTNNLGLVNLEIGRGQNPSGALSDINWAEGNYFIQIAMDENGGTNFKPMGVAQLLSVPYALHSGSAFSLSGSKLGGGVVDGIPSNVWSTFGNSETNPPEDRLGTTDATDLMMITNDIERLRIKSDGNVEIARSLQVDENMTVKRDVFLNSESGSTMNYGPFTVANLSPTLLSGTLTVDEATDLNSSLNVDGVTDLNSSLNVNNNSATTLTGTLLVNQDATFNQHITLDNASLGSTGPFTGALVVAGGVGIGENLNVAGDADFDGNVTINGPLALSDTTPSYSTTTGALTVAGGTGISKQLNVGGSTYLRNSLTVTGPATFYNSMAAFGQMTITANPGAGNGSNYGDYPMRIQGGSQGVAIKVNGSRDTTKNFVSFWDDDGGSPTMWGRIEGLQYDELEDDAEYKTQNTIFLWEIAIEGANYVMALIDVVAASTSSTACAGLGACVTAPVPSLIVAAIAKAVIQAANVILVAYEHDTYNEFQYVNIGVTYQSGAGDYAEWLRKANPAEKFQPGELVGVTHGKISHTTAGADKVMVISYNPIVLGNMPQEGKENEYEKVAFMGQVPVKVLGIVSPGDYIIASGNNDGYGIAIGRDELKLADYSNIAGVAWTGSGSSQPGMVNVAVGLEMNGLSKRVAQQEAEISAMKHQLNKTFDLLAQFIPELKDSLDYYDVESENPFAQQDHYAANEPEEQFYSAPDENKVVYFEVSRDQVEESFDLARTTLENQGIDVENHPFFIKARSEPGYKEQFIEDLTNSLNLALATRQKIDRKAGYQTEKR